MVNVKAHTRRTKYGLVRIKAHRRACSGKRYAVYGKVRGQPEGILWKVDKAGKKVPMIFKSKKRAVKRGEIWKRGMDKKKLKAKYTIGSGTKKEKKWEMESRLDVWKRKFEARKR